MTMNTPEPQTSLFTVQTWRENFLQLLLRGTSIIGLFALIAIFFVYEEPLFLTIFSAFYALILIATFVRMPYQARAWIFTIIFYFLAINGLAETGASGSARMFFIAFVMVAGMLFSTRTTIAAAGFSLVTIGVAMWLALSGRYVPLRETYLAQLPSAWTIAIVSIVLLDTIIILGMSLLQNGFEQAQKDAQASLEALTKERVSLEQSVAARTRELAEKTRQLEAASYVARRIAEIRDLQVLLNEVSVSIAEQFKLYHVGIFLLDDKDQFAVLQAASSEGGRKMLELGHRLAVGQTGIVGYVTGQGRPRVALDTGADAVFFDNPHLPHTHSEMALPLLVRGKVIGALDIQSDKIDAFSEGDVDVLQTVADQLAIAVENTRLFSESDAVISQFEALTALQTRDAWANYTRRKIPAYQFSAFGVRPAREIPQEEGPRSLRIPIELRGQEIGAIRLHRRESAPAWSSLEGEIAREIAAQVALALDTSRLLEETQKNAARDEMVASVSNKFRETLDMETILQTAATELRNVFGLTEAEVRLTPPTPSDRAVS
ncbi:MAG: GAF domain-containing protein [Chloroflexota bacterium]